MRLCVRGDPQLGACAFEAQDVRMQQIGEDGNRIDYRLFASEISLQDRGVHIYLSSEARNNQPSVDRTCPTDGCQVGERGFEPPTTCTPYKCATGLRYSPSNGIISEWRGITKWMFLDVIVYDWHAAWV